MTSHAPLILGFDTSAAHCAAAITLGDHLLGEVSESMTRGQAERLIPLIQDMMADAGVTWRDLHCIGVGTGPGNFTGIRIAIAAARGLALSLKIPAIGISRLEAATLTLPRPVLSCLMSRKDLIYIQFFDGLADHPPISTTLSELPLTALPMGVTCTGDAAHHVAPHCAGPVQEPVFRLARSIALLAASRIDHPSQRPSPLYIRDADAAPPKDTAPTLLS